MGIGNSGRIVIEVAPEAKRRLYAALAREGLTLKDWFLINAEQYLAEIDQLPLSFSHQGQRAPEVGITDSKELPTRGDDK